MTAISSGPGPVASGNPAFGEKAMGEYFTRPATATSSMTVTGTAVKTAFLLVVLVAGGAWGWASATEPVAVDIGAGYGNTTVTIPGGFWLASLGAFLVGIMAAMNPRRAGLLGIVYAGLQGYCLGAISAAYDAQTEGIVGAAVAATVAVFLVALLLYVTGIVKPTRTLAFAVAAGLGGLCLLYLFVAVLAVFDWSWLYSDQFQTMGAIVSVVAVVLAALSFTLDFGSIERGTAAGAPRFMEWYAAWGLMVTFIWLYLTLLRLLAFVMRNR